MAPRQTKPDLATLYASAKAGDKRAVGQLLELLRPGIAAVIWRHVRKGYIPANEVDDLIHETLGRLLRALPAHERGPGRASRPGCPSFARRRFARARKVAVRQAFPPRPHET
jgi:hypothetical protein